MTFISSELSIYKFLQCCGTNRIINYLRGPTSVKGPGHMSLNLQKSRHIKTDFFISFSCQYDSYPLLQWFYNLKLYAFQYLCLLQ